MVNDAPVGLSKSSTESVDKVVDNLLDRKESRAVGQPVKPIA
jgi:hypothetical protein